MYNDVWGIATQEPLPNKFFGRGRGEVLKVRSEFQQPWTQLCFMMRSSLGDLWMALLEKILERALIKRSPNCNTFCNDAHHNLID